MPGQTVRLAATTLDGATARGLARTLAKDFAARAAQHDREASLPAENFAALREAGLLGLTVPAMFGGLGLGLADASAVVGTIAGGCGATALILAMQYLQHAAIADGAWPSAVRRLVGEAAVRDGALINALRVEPDLGTPSRGGLPATVARRVADGWRISGRKLYSTGSTLLRWGAVFARTDDDAPRMGYFLVPLGADGIEIEASWDHIGMRATGSHTVVMRDVALPAEYAVDLRAPEAWRAPDERNLVWIAVVLAALYDGIARAARDWLAVYLNERKPANLGAPLASLPRFQELMGEIEARLLANRALLDHATKGPISAAEAGLVKHVVTGNAIELVERGMAAIGNPGLSRANPIERHYRDVLCSRVHMPQADVILAAAGRAALSGPG